MKNRHSTGIQLHRALCLAVTLASLIGCHTRTAVNLPDSQRRDQIATMIADYQRLFPDISGIGANELQQSLERGEITLVDVRPEAERAVSMIPGAISKQEFEQRAEELSGSEVVTYCTIGYRSGAYAQQLMADGWAVRNFDGSLLAWTHAGGELIDSKGEPTRRLHVYGRQWALAADGYEAVW